MGFQGIQGNNFLAAQQIREKLLEEGKQKDVKNQEAKRSTGSEGASSGSSVAKAPPTKVTPQAPKQLTKAEIKLKEFFHKISDAADKYASAAKEHFLANAKAKLLTSPNNQLNDQTMAALVNAFAAMANTSPLGKNRGLRQDNANDVTKFFAQSKQSGRYQKLSPKSIEIAEKLIGEIQSSGGLT